jgi:hypothetical protein
MKDLDTEQPQNEYTLEEGFRWERRQHLICDPFAMLQDWYRPVGMCQMPLWQLGSVLCFDNSFPCLDLPALCQV